MITGAIVNALLSALDAVFSLLPSFTITPPGNSGVMNIVGNMNGIVPIQTCVQILLLAITVIVGQRLWDFGVFVFHQFWGSD